MRAAGRYVLPFKPSPSPSPPFPPLSLTPPSHTPCGLPDLKLHLSSTDYGNFLADVPGALKTSMLEKRAWDKLVGEFEHMRLQAVQPLAQFMEYIRYQYMIDNVVFLITGTLHGKDAETLLSKCHPLGKFDSMATLTVATTAAELYDYVLVETPLAGYFVNASLQEGDLDEMNIEIIRSTLYKAYLEDFYKFVCSLGGVTASVMKEILEFEADRRSINITINSFGTELSVDDKKKLYPSFGQLYPEGIDKLLKAEDLDMVRAAVDFYTPLDQFFDDVDGIGGDSLEDKFIAHEVHLHKESFNQQYHLGVFYSFLKLKEQEIRNLLWIAECIAQNQRDQMPKFVPMW